MLFCCRNTQEIGGVCGKYEMNVEDGEHIL